MDSVVNPEIQKLKEQLANLIVEYDDLMYYICPEIEIEYYLEFGKCEYELYRIELEIDKLKRKLDLINTGLNEINKIEKKLNSEFEESEKQLQVQIDEINILEKNEFERLSQDEYNDLKSIYRVLIEKLHPNLNPDQTFVELSLFLKSVDSFKNGDLKSLESVSEIVPEAGSVKMPAIEDLKDLIKDFKEKIDKVKNDYPYNKKELLENPDSGNEYKDMLIELINDRKDDVKKLESKINELI